MSLWPLHGQVKRTASSLKRPLRFIHTPSYYNISHLHTRLYIHIFWINMLLWQNEPIVLMTGTCVDNAPEVEEFDEGHNSEGHYKLFKPLKMMPSTHASTHTLLCYSLTFSVQWIYIRLEMGKEVFPDNEVWWPTGRDLSPQQRAVSVWIWFASCK